MLELSFDRVNFFIVVPFFTQKIFQKGFTINMLPNASEP